MDRNRKRVETVAAWLDGETTLALATTSLDGSASVAPLFYLRQEGLQLYWFSSASSEHSRNVERNPQAAVSVYHHTAEWKEIRGVQMRGHVSAVSDHVLRDSIREVYIRRFQLGEEFDAAIAASTLYRFQPEWVRYLDNSRSFGYQFELNLAPPGRSSE